MICPRKIRRQDKVPFTLLSNSLYVDHNINSGIRQFFAASEARAADNSCVLTASTLRPPDAVRCYKMRVLLSAPERNQENRKNFALCDNYITFKKRLQVIKRIAPLVTPKNFAANKHPLGAFVKLFSDKRRPRIIRAEL